MLTESVSTTATAIRSLLLLLLCRCRRLSAISLDREEEEQTGIKLLISQFAAATSHEQARVEKKGRKKKSDQGNYEQIEQDPSDRHAGRTDDGPTVFRSISSLPHSLAASSAPNAPPPLLQPTYLLPFIVARERESGSWLIFCSSPACMSNFVGRMHKQLRELWVSALAHWPVRALCR